MPIKLRSQQGFSLIELVVGISVGLLVLLSVTAFFIVNSHFGNQQLQRNYVHTQLLLLIHHMQSQITHAGFCFDCKLSNPYQLLDNEGNYSTILIDESATKQNGICIRFAYNHNKRTNATSIDDEDARGFRLGTNSNGDATIEIYENRDGLANWHCENSEQFSAYWQDMTFNTLVVDEFTLSRQRFWVSSQDNYSQQITLTIALSLKDDSQIREKATLQINVANVDQ